MLSPDPDTAAQDAADPSHAADLSALAVAVAAQPTSGDLAVVSVVRLRPGVFSDEYFRSWRDTFDTGACSQAGGVAGTAESTIAGHQAYIGHCAGGLLTYHVHLADGDDRIVSISSLGPGRLGELVVDGLQMTAATRPSRAPDPSVPRAGPSCRAAAGSRRRPSGCS